MKNDNISKCKAIILLVKSWFSFLNSAPLVFHQHPDNFNLNKTATIKSCISYNLLCIKNIFHTHTCPISINTFSSADAFISQSQYCLLYFCFSTMNILIIFPFHKYSINHKLFPWWRTERQPWALNIYCGVWISVLKCGDYIRCCNI